MLISSIKPVWKSGKIKNVPSRLNPGQIKTRLLSGAPNIADGPLGFLRGLKSLEESAGTCQALLIGLLAAEKVRRPEEMMEGLDLLNRICARLPENRRQAGPVGIKNLFWRLEPHFSFYSEQNDFLSGLRNFESNLRGSSINVGTCIINAGIFALLTLNFGHLTGAAHPVDQYHALAYYPEYDAAFSVDINKTGLVHYPPSPEVLFTHAFSLIASKINLDVAARFKQFNSLSVDELNGFLRRLDCSKALNPYLLTLYRLRMMVNESLGNISEMHSDRYFYQQISELTGGISGI